MNTIINTDNYEAYLLDYMEGNLSPDKAEQLKTFVTAQGLDWDELTEELPHLEAPQIAYESKEDLKKKAVVTPLYVKIASAAAAAGLLLTVTLWPEKQLPKVEPVAELKPILPERFITANEITVLPPKTTTFVQPKTIAKERSLVLERAAMPLMAQLEPQKPNSLPTSPFFDEPDFALLSCQLNTDFAFVQHDGIVYSDNAEEEREASLIGKGLLWLTHGRHDNFASLIGSGMRKAKQDLTEAATDMALATYYHADERIEEAKGRWQEKRGE